MNRDEVYSKCMECDKEFLVKYLLYLDECVTKYEKALNKACHKLWIAEGMAIKGR